MVLADNFAHQSFRKQTMPDSPPSPRQRPTPLSLSQRPTLGRTDSPPSPRTPGPSPKSVLRIDASGLYIFPPKEKPASPRRHQRRLSRAGSLGSQNSLVSIDEESALTPAAVKKALQGQQQGSAGVWNKRRCAALVAVWTYAIIYFAALYSYRPSRLEAMRLRRVIRGA
ncbi:unnamed protein product [Pelagomonas calceolata]|uniref:Uncharacterized protein n=1 Tax=Pelagomonas calceolata TaxID=35677 RepID=A0A8J2SZ65_9STRA|nr:unnamed protein product [Pelagomonas calceolata]